MRLVEYCITTPNMAMAIYSIKYGWRIPKGWQPQRSFDFLLHGDPEPTTPAETVEAFDPIPEDFPELWEAALAGSACWRSCWNSNSGLRCEGWKSRKPDYMKENEIIDLVVT